MSKEIIARQAMPLTQTLTDLTKQLIDSKTRFDYTNNDVIIGTWISPNSLSHEEHNIILQDFNRVKALYPEPSKEWLGGRIATLLSHYYMANTNEAIATAVAVDWLESLQYIPQSYIERACRTWLEEEKRKPTPSDIRKLAIKFAPPEFYKFERICKLLELPVREP